MMFHLPLDRPLRPLVVAFVVFLLAAVAATTMIRRGEQHRRQEERTLVSNVVDNHADALERSIERALSATYALAVLVRQGNGAIRDFDAIASGMLSLYPGVASLQLAPRGVVRSIVPLAGNEPAIGHDLLKDPARTKAAFVARDTGKLTLDGPFDLLQGGQGAVGRLPVFLDDAKGEPFFWGFTSVLIRFPGVLEAANFPGLTEQGFAYELWRSDPASGQKLIIAASSSSALIDPVERNIELPYGNWTLSAAPVKGWGDPLGLSLNATLGLLFSLLLAYVAKLLVESRAHEQGLEALVAQRTAEVRAREADLNRAQSVARVGSWVLDLTRNEFHGSTEALRIFGVSAGGPFNFEVFLERVHPDDRIAINRAWQAARKGEPYDIEYRIMIGATIRSVHSYAELPFEADGTQQRALGTVQDITERKLAEQALRDSAESLRLFADNVPAMTVSYDENQRCRFANKRYANFFGFSATDILGKHLREVTGEEAYREIEGYFVRVLQGHPVTFQRTHKLANGESRNLEIKLLPQIGDQGKVLGWFAVATDITEYKLAEQALRDSAESLRLFADNVPAMTSSWDENLRCRFANKVYAEFYGFTVENILGKPLREVIREEVYREFEAHFVQVLRGHSVTYQRTHKLANGESRYLEVKLVPHIGDQGKVLGFFAVTTDITEHKLTEERIQGVAHHDSLTGLSNRLLFNDRLNQAISLAKRDSRQFALLYLDLDRFKPVNDALGHAAGDDLLQAVAARIRHQVRESDTVARVGGDEFAVILPDIARREEAETVARKIIAAVATPFQLGSQKQSVDIGASIGIAIYPTDAQDIDALVKAADAAMYKAKQVRNSFRFYAG